MNKLTARVTIEQDYDNREPWRECDCYGVVSEWTSRAKFPGERVLCSDRYSRRYYDVAATMTKARAEGWNAAPYTGTRGECASRAVEADYQRLRAWCEGNWYYAVVHVELVDDDTGNVVADQYLGGVESDYADEQAREMESELREQYFGECAERAQWESRGVMTVAA